MDQKQSLVIELEKDWKFCRGEVKRWRRLDHDTCYNTTKAGQDAGDMAIFRGENPWQTLSIPHDWSTAEASDPSESPDNGFKPRGIGWYYIDIPLPEYAEDAFIQLEFEGIMGESVVYVNGVLAARSESGYTGFSLDISDYVLPGETATIIVSVDNTRWEGWWYEGAGIYRPARIRILPPVHLRHLGTFARASRDGDHWNVRVSSDVDSSLEAAAQAELRWTLRDSDGATVAEARASLDVPPYGSAAAEASAAIGNPQLWSPDAPRLYALEAALWAEDRCVETQTVPLGFREIEWTDHGMFINGRLTPVRGICCHQDHAGVGIAVTKSVIRYRIQKLKAMGCNAYRCAHHCPSDYLLQVCDELGMLVMVENRHYRTSDEVMAQLDHLTLLSRNHPSVFLYSLFNEEPWQAEKRGRRMAAKMLRRIRINDDTRPVTAAMNGGVLTRENASDVLDVAGMNYFIDDYNTYARRRPGHPMVGTENGPLYATRGIYKSDPEAQVYDSYGLNTAFFGQRLQETMEAVEAAPHVAGLFVWGGFDYRGEPQPFEWPSVVSHWGLTDNCGFEKDTFYMLKSYYSDPDHLMLHLLPHWNWPEGETVRVCAMTNCDTVQLFLNDRPLERQTVVRRRAEWQVPFEPGVIRAVTEKDGVVLTEEVRTAGAPARIEVIDAAPATDYDASIINVYLTDAKGVPVPGRAHDRAVRYDVHSGTLIGVGNGDPNGTQPDLAHETPTFCGRCQAIIRPDAGGHVRVTVSADGLPPVEISR